MGGPGLTAVFAAADPVALGRFWEVLLGRTAVGGAGRVCLPGPGAQLDVCLVRSARPVPRPGRMHLHLTSDGELGQHGHVQRALEAGGRNLDVGQRPDEGHVVLADPEGNELCVIERGNAFLAGCGLLGELACDGTRDVGAFWSAALGWPLVWDQRGETAIQDLSGGTKVAWGGPPVAPVRDHEGSWLELATDEPLVAEVARLVGLGAGAPTPVPGGVQLRDPDGAPFVLRRR